MVFYTFCGETVYGQTKSYLAGQKTGKKYQAGSLIGLGTGTAGLSTPMSTEAWGCSLGIQNNQFRFYYGDSNILNGSTSNSTTLKSARSFGVLGALGAGGDVFLQFRNTNNENILAGTPTYFKLKERPTNTGIAVTVGGLLGVVELNSITGEGYSGAIDYKLNTAIYCFESYNGLENNGSVAGTSTTHLLLDAFGDWYARVTPNADYNAVRLNVAFPTDLAIANVDAEINVNVYHAFTQTAGGVCNTNPQFTSPGEALGGITLNTAGVGGLQLSQLVANPQNAINGNPTDFSSFSSGLASVGVANSVAQSFYFDHKASANDGVRFQLGIQNSLVDLDLLKLSSIKFRAYNGSATTPVYQSNLNDIASLLQLNLLNLITINGSTHKKLDLTFKPEVVFDRVEVVFDQGVAAIGVLGDALRIYEVNLAPSSPLITLQPSTENSTNICEGSTANFTVTAQASSGGVISSYQWQYLNTSNDWTDIPLETQATLNIASVTNELNNRLYRVKVVGGNVSCLQEIYSNGAMLTVSPKPTITLGANPEICIGTLTASLPYTATTGTQYKISWSGGSALLNVPYTNFPTSSPISIAIAALAATGTHNGSITVKNASGCESNPINFEVMINPKLPTPNVTITSN